MIDPEGFDLNMPHHGISAGDSLPLATLLDKFGEGGWELVSFLPEKSVRATDDSYLVIFKRRYKSKKIIDWQYDVWFPITGVLFLAWILLAPFLYFDPLSLEIDLVHLTGIKIIDFALWCLLVLMPLLGWLYIFSIALWKLVCWLGTKIYDSMYEDLEDHYLKKSGREGINAFLTPREKDQFTDSIHFRVKLILLITGVAILGLIYLFEGIYVSGKI